MTDTTDPIRAASPPVAGGELPFITTDLPGIGGTLKERTEDFLVEEIPAYLPSGTGEFIYLWIEKEDLSAEQLTSHLAKFLRIAHQDIGMAGLKDRQAITRQWVSVPVRCEALLPEIRHGQIRVLESGRHANKLRTGHLRGNRFSILLRRVSDDAVDRANAIAAKLRQSGVPNFFGEQRFGRDNETLELGLGLLRGDRKPSQIPMARRKFLLRLALSAVQSHLFNQALSARMQAGTLHTAQLGDVMQVVASGGPFVVEDPALEQPRLDSHEIVVSGPLYGPKMKASAGDVAARENEILSAAGFTLEAFTRYANLTPGTRRPYLIWIDDLTIVTEGSGLRLSFSLPSGSYATVVLREFQKNPALSPPSQGGAGGVG